MNAELDSTFNIKLNKVKNEVLCSLSLFKNLLGHAKDCSWGFLESTIKKKAPIIQSDYEIKALEIQGFSKEQALTLIELFNKGENIDNFVFHFTSENGAKGITESKYIIGDGEFSLHGKGVYAGSIPNPSNMKLHGAFPFGWGLRKHCKYRIPIDISNIKHEVHNQNIVVIREKKLFLDKNSKYIKRYTN